MFINHTPLKDLKSSAVCHICDRRTRPVFVDSFNEPDLWNMPKGWSQSPFPADYVHRDGSQGSFYTCSHCNARLRRGEELTVRSGALTRKVS